MLFGAIQHLVIIIVVLITYGYDFLLLEEVCLVVSAVHFAPYLTDLSSIMLV